MTTPTTETARTAIRKARGSLTRYRVMAIVTGVMLLVLCVEMISKYLTHTDGLTDALRWVPQVHGGIYILYLVTVLDLWTKMRWGWGRLVAMVLAGVVPVMSFILERTVHQDADAKLAGLEAQYGDGK